MAAMFKDLEAQALALPAGERSALVSTLLESLEGTYDDSAQAVAKAWDDEIAHRVAEFEAGRTQGVPYEQVRAELREMIDSHAKL